MTDLERLKGMYLMRPEEQGWAIIDAHEKEDAERETLLSGFQAEGWDVPSRTALEAELARLREALRIIAKNGSYSDALLAAEALRGESDG